MSQDAIGKILEAEEQAEVLCRVASERAAEMRAEARHKGEAQLAEVEKTTAEEYRKQLELVQRETVALQEKKRQDAENAAQLLGEAAQTHMEEAVKMIVWGIVEKCQ